MKTMAKSLKSLLLALVIIPVAFVFSACGGANQLATKATCDTTGTYSASTSAELETVMGTEEITSFADANGFRITSSMVAEMQGVTMEYNINAIMKANEFAMEMVVKVTDEDDTKMSLYYKDSTFYMNADGQKAKYTLDASMLSTMLAATTMCPIDLQDMSQFLDLAKTSGAVVTRVADTNRFKVDLSACMPTEMTDLGFSGDLSIYVNFDENNNLVGMKMVGNCSMNLILAVLPCEMEVSLSAFNGEIEYPDFSGYQEVVA